MPLFKDDRILEEEAEKGCSFEQEIEPQYHYQKGFEDPDEHGVAAHEMYSSYADALCNR